MSTVRQLGLKWQTRAASSRKTGRQYLDFTLDGSVFLDPRYMGDNISCLGWLPPHLEVELIERLLLKRANNFGSHFLLYICPECGDIDCGAFATTIRRTADHFVWSNFCFINSYDRAMTTVYDEIEPIYFDKTQYWDAFQPRLSELKKQRP